jgi:hypothetical protein
VLSIDQGAFTLPSEPASVLSPADLAAQAIVRERQLRLRVWVLLVLPADEIGAILQSSTPPTITQLVALARKRAEVYAGKCSNCGVALPTERGTRPKKRRKRKKIDGYKRGKR